ncbi:STAS/SEC14 domain-containing protein [Hymenobacter sp. DG01]|uniref:STAS/SEC14 domain-containing protein n=1 Tax=Hymenobacter sp. DG01 TaxID=2584940 RepID=UPI00112124CA|nr:STAS/SEC14 domain-containing protein [Hymenobacter sp. DG01]
MEMVFENQHCTIFFDPASRCLHQTWTGFATGPLLREAHEATLELLSRHGVQQVLADTREMRTILRTDQQWITDDFFPRALARGYRRVAVVVSADMFNQLSVRAILDPVLGQSAFTVEYFGNLETARAWLYQAG